MKKIPTLFLRDENDRQHVIPQVNPEAAWARNGDAVPTRKYDGTCVMFDGLSWWARREVKPGKKAPIGYAAISTDTVTGKTMGWEPATQSAFAKYLLEALDSNIGDRFDVGTYELIGPKINGNPEKLALHMLQRHADAEILRDVPLDFEGLRAYLADFPHEGIVWHGADGRMAKLKVRDFA